MSETAPRYTALPEDERPLDETRRPLPPAISIFDRPAITVKRFRRMRSITIDMMAWVEAHDLDGQFTDKIHELRSIINGE